LLGGSFSQVNVELGQGVVLSLWITVGSISIADETNLGGNWERSNTILMQFSLISQRNGLNVVDLRGGNTSFETATSSNDRAVPEDNLFGKNGGVSIGVVVPGKVTQLVFVTSGFPKEGNVEKGLVF